MKETVEVQGGVNKSPAMSINNFLKKLTVVFVFTACTPYVKAQPGITSTQFIKDSIFSIQVPDYLVRVNDMNDQAELQFKNIFMETYMLVTSEDLSAEFAIEGEQLTSAQLLFETKLRTKGAVLETAKSMIINGYRAMQSEVILTVDGTSLKYLVTFIESPRKLFKIYSWTLAENTEKYFGDFRSIANSFKTI